MPEILQLVGLGDKFDRFPNELSGGEQQRVSIARAFVNHPPLLICDEPTGNLDPDTSVGIMQLLYRINRTGTTVVMATHDREMVDRMRRRVIALDSRTARPRRPPRRLRRGMSLRFRFFVGRGAALAAQQLRHDARRDRHGADRDVLARRLRGARQLHVQQDRAGAPGREGQRLPRRDASSKRQIGTCASSSLAQPRRSSRSTYVSKADALKQLAQELGRRHRDPRARSRSTRCRAKLEVKPTIPDQAEGGGRRRCAAARRREGRGRRRLRRQDGRPLLRSGAIIEAVIGGADPAAGSRGGAPDREHHPALDLRAPARGRGDEARRRDELVRAPARSCSRA